jgi:hypothetical protein
MHNCCYLQTEILISGNKRTCIKNEAWNNTPFREKANKAKALEREDEKENQ